MNECEKVFIIRKYGQLICAKCAHYHSCDSSCPTSQKPKINLKELGFFFETNSTESLLWAQLFQHLSFVPREKSIWVFEGKTSPCQVRCCFWCKVLQKKISFVCRSTPKNELPRSTTQIGPSLLSRAIGCSPKRNPSWQYFVKTYGQLICAKCAHYHWPAEKKEKGCGQKNEATPENIVSGKNGGQTERCRGRDQYFANRSSHTGLEIRVPGKPKPEIATIATVSKVKKQKSTTK